jgi:hypothetical protein
MRTRSPFFGEDINDYLASEQNRRRHAAELQERGREARADAGGWSFGEDQGYIRMGIGRLALLTILRETRYGWEAVLAGVKPQHHHPNRGRTARTSAAA